VHVAIVRLWTNLLMLMVSIYFLISLAVSYD
jgi:hypothetical protein